MLGVPVFGVPVLGMLALAVLAGCEAKWVDDEEAEPPPPPAVTSPCESIVFEGSPFTHCTANPQFHSITMALAPPAPDGEAQPWRSLARFAAARPADAAPIAFVMNGGMYNDAGQPVGYYVEHGERLQALNRRDGPGNFHMKPNGVFFGNADGRWQVLQTESFYAEISSRPAFGTQSGPMLVVDGELHPDLDTDGESRKIRNGVGVDLSGRAHFVISDAPVSFGKLARYFRDVLGTRQALFLDGTVSQMWDPAKGRLDSGAPLGPLIVVENRATAAP